LLRSVLRFRPAARTPRSSRVVTPRPSQLLAFAADDGRTTLMLSTHGYDPRWIDDTTWAFDVAAVTG
jgi:hypothetical protein